MQYMGSKTKISKEIVPLMLKDRKEGQYWVEPFVGGANMIDKVEGNRIGADFNEYLVQALLAIRDNLNDLPKDNLEFTEVMYKELRKSDEYRFKGYASFAFSFGAKFMGGWSKNAKGDDYVARAFRNAQQQSPKLQDVKIIHSSYNELEIPKESIIYCDPPYEGTTKYKDSFDHTQFWEWCREKVKERHKVFVSEYSAPEDFICVWSKEVKTLLNKNSQSDLRVEKLFVHESQYDTN